MISCHWSWKCCQQAFLFNQHSFMFTKRSFVRLWNHRLLVVYCKINWFNSMQINQDYHLVIDQVVSKRANIPLTLKCCFAQDDVDSFAKFFMETKKWPDSFQRGLFNSRNVCKHWLCHSDQTLADNKWIDSYQHKWSEINEIKTNRSTLSSPPQPNFIQHWD